ncbi:MAG: hypothetical protein A49_23900 [Methyloceanibacter sp.]|nr:MAG: hypothetical protein A49_23900 [Methyloceanibacter sp.]
MSHAKDNNHKPSVADESALEAIVRRVLSATGRIVPRTEEEVADAEAHIKEEDIRLPEKLRRPPVDPLVHDAPLAEPLREKPHTVASENLARAARFGKPIPEEIQRRMEEDRSNAEREANGDE